MANEKLCLKWNDFQDVLIPSVGKLRDIVGNKLASSKLRYKVAIRNSAHPLTYSLTDMGKV